MNLPNFKLAINFAPAQLMSPSIVETIRSALAASKLDARFLEIEVTESALVAASEGNSQIMHAIKALGVTISVDDFGTGVSTLSYLKNFPVDVLKLDATLIRNLPGDEEDVAIVTAIIKLALDLHIKVVAEGVETIEQLSFLRTTSCHTMQGFLFSEAVRPDKFEVLLKNRKLDGQFIH
jgi:EAL domain-containing protein (putative c-di-GMP-specific phosphodiesterase class I)